MSKSYFAAFNPSKGYDTDLLDVSIFVDSQWTTTVTIAGRLSVRSIGADVRALDGSKVVLVALGVGDNIGLDKPENFTDTAGT